MADIVTAGTYQEFKRTLDTELAKTAESFVRIGWLLKVARDTEVLRESGYSTVAEFAKAEYGLSKDIVSRYIHINDRFSENGYSEKLAEQYRGFGYSKLAEMLTLPDTIVDALDPKMTRQQIQQVKEEVKQEQQITPLEVMTEQKNKEQQELKTDLQKFVHQFGHDNREKVRTLVNATAGNDFVERIMDVLAPSGIAMLSVRIPGRGKMMLSIKGKDNKLTLLDVRANDSFDCLWDDLREDIQTVYQEGTEEAWERIYKEPFKTKNEGREKNVIKSNDSGNDSAGDDKKSTYSKTTEADKQKNKETGQDDGQISGRRIEETQLVKVKAITEEVKDKLFDIWFEHVSTDKIEAACKMMSHMKFTELINTTPKKLFLLVQTSEVTTNELVRDGIPLTEVTTEKYTGTFTSQEFQKRFNRKYLELYKKKAADEVEGQEEKVAPVQQDFKVEKLTKRALEKVAEIVQDELGTQLEMKLTEITEYVVNTVKEVSLEFINEEYRVSFYTDKIMCRKGYEVIFEKKADAFYSDIVVYLQETETEQQIPGQMQVDDYPEIQPTTVLDDGYKNIALRALPGDTLYFIDNTMKEARLKEGTVIRITIEERLIPHICVESNINCETIIDTFNQKDDWGVKLFKTRAAAEKVLARKE